MLRPALGARVGLRLAHRRPTPSLAARRLPTHLQSRTFLSYDGVYDFPPVKLLSEVILDTPLPSYALTIICLTFALRMGLTFPTTLWQRARMARTKEFIAPQMKAKNDELAQEFLVRGRRDGWSYEEYKKQLKRALANYQYALHKKYNTHPTITMLAPLLVNIPILVVTSLAIRGALDIENSPLALEYVPWLGVTLGERDPTMILPLLSGFLAMSNAELASWNREQALNPPVDTTPPVTTTTPPTPAKGVTPTAKTIPTKRHISTSAILNAVPPPRRRIMPRPKQDAAKPPSPAPTSTPAKAKPQPPSPELVDVGDDKDAKAQRVVNVTRGSMINSAVMRGVSILFIPFAMVMPSALVIYWSSSMAFTLLQTSFFALVDKRERAAKAIKTSE